MKDARAWLTETALIPRVGWNVTVTCEGHHQGTWGPFHTEAAAARYGRRQIKWLQPITPPGTEIRTGGTWA